MTYSERIRNEIWSDKELQKRFNNHRHGGAIDRAIKLAYSFGKQDRDADLIKAVTELRIKKPMQKEHLGWNYACEKVLELIKHKAK